MANKDLGYNFNSHARVGRDSVLKLVQLVQQNFNSHARVGRDEQLGEDKTSILIISTHTPV